jgi:hypothetical protein
LISISSPSTFFCFSWSSLPFSLHILLLTPFHVRPFTLLCTVAYVSFSSSIRHSTTRYISPYLPSFILTYSLHGAESFLRS